MSELNSKNIRVFANFLSRLAKEMTRFYYLKLNKPFKTINKSKDKKGYDPVTKADRAFEKFIRSKIKKYSNKDVSDYISKKEKISKKIIYNYCLTLKK